MTTPASVSVTVPARELRRALAAVLPHTGRDDQLPSLTRVRFEITAGWLYLAATDRYSLAAARIQGPVSGPVPADTAWLLPRRSAETLAGLLGEFGDFATVTFTPDPDPGRWPTPGGSLTVAADGGTAGTWATEPGDFPKWREMLAKILAAPPAELDGPHGVDARKLARFTDPAEDSPRESGLLAMRVTVGGTIGERPAPILVVTRGSWFLGAAMPVRRDPNDAADGAGSWAAALGQPAGTVAEDG